MLEAGSSELLIGIYLWQFALGRDALCEFCVRLESVILLPWTDLLPLDSQCFIALRSAVARLLSFIIWQLVS